MKKYLISVYYSTMLLFGKRIHKAGDILTSFVFFFAVLTFWNIVMGICLAILELYSFTDSFDTIILICFTAIFYKLILLKKENYLEAWLNKNNQTNHIKKKKAIIFYVGIVVFLCLYIVTTYLLRDFIHLH